MTKPHPKDPLLEGLAALPPRDLDEPEAARILRVARRAFEREHAEGHPAWLSRASHAWSRFVVPAVLAGTAVLYLSWAFTFVTVAH